MGNPHGSVTIQLGRNQTQAALICLSVGIDEHQDQAQYNEGEDRKRIESECSQGLTVYGKLMQSAKDKGWVNAEGTWVAE